MDVYLFRLVRNDQDGLLKLDRGHRKPVLFLDQFAKNIYIVPALFDVN